MVINFFILIGVVLATNMVAFYNRFCYIYHIRDFKIYWHLETSFFEV
jgi:hypothetical protein